jgi:hypothetical protein
VVCSQEDLIRVMEKWHAMLEAKGWRQIG